jgi:hypothetical protein
MKGRSGPYFNNIIKKTFESQNEPANNFDKLEKINSSKNYVRLTSNK